MMIPLVTGGIPVATIAFATLVVNLRHAFYGLSLLHRLPAGRLQRWYVIFGLTDETYSVLTTLPESGSRGRMTLIVLLNHVWWVSGSAIGALIGARAQINLVGLDFALVALFAVLVVEQWRTSRNPAPLLVALASYGLAHFFFAAQALIVSILLSTLAGLVCHGKTALSAEVKRD
jgi:4-azaleucine resistance transporter AzlC